MKCLLYILGTVLSILLTLFPLKFMESGVPRSQELQEIDVIVPI